MENAFSHSFSIERRLKFLTRKLEEITEILQSAEEEATSKMDMFFHKLRGTAATFDFMELDTLAHKAHAIKGKTSELFDCMSECRKKIEELVSALSNQVRH
jgi:hypothetical protein